MTARECVKYARAKVSRRTQLYFMLFSVVEACKSVSGDSVGLVDKHTAWGRHIRSLTLTTKNFLKIVEDNISDRRHSN